MEWVAYIAGEAHSDSPSCVSPLLAAFARSWNDGLDDEARQRLRPRLGRTVGTAGDGLDEWRAWLCADWLLRRSLPVALEQAGLAVGPDELADARRAAAAARRARAKRETPARDAARAATAMAARLSGADAARAALRALPPHAERDAVWTLAWSAERDAWWAAAWQAGPDARAVLAPAAAELQRSAFDLLDRMLGGERLEVGAMARELVAAT
jgi:hypothetical protein